MPTLFDTEGKVVRPVEGLDYFNAFGVPRSFALDQTELTRTYKRLQKQLHPDLFTLRPPEEQEVSSEWSALVNDAYKVLQKPLPRALYLLRLAGYPLDEEISCVVVPPEFLAEVSYQTFSLADHQYSR
jgi:molecular chaperone HscB